LGQHDGIYKNLNAVYEKASVELHKQMQRRAKERAIKQTVSEPKQRALSAVRPTRNNAMSMSMSGMGSQLG